MSSVDGRLFARIRCVILSLKNNVQSVLHRHLSTEAQREQADMMNILHEYHDLEGKALAHEAAYFNYHCEVLSLHKCLIESK